MHVSQLLPEELQVPVVFDDVELTEEEAQAALNDARRKKQGLLEHERLRRLEAQRENDLRRPWTVNELYAYFHARATALLQNEQGRKDVVFEPMEWQKSAITALCLYFTNDPRFEELDPTLFNRRKKVVPFSLNKGIWLWSNPGCGKTLLMNCFSRNRRQCYKVVQTSKIAGGYKAFGDQHIQKYSDVIEETPSPYNFFQASSGICYNDLGMENPDSKNFGTSVNVMESIFHDTYERRVPFWHRHVTTNLSSDQITEMYGERIIDRIRQCFNIIQIEGESLR